MMIQKINCFDYHFVSHRRRNGFLPNIIIVELRNSKSLYMSDDEQLLPFTVPSSYDQIQEKGRSAKLYILHY